MSSILVLICTIQRYLTDHVNKITCFLGHSMMPGFCARAGFEWPVSLIQFCRATNIEAHPCTCGPCSIISLSVNSGVWHVPHTKVEGVYYSDGN